MLPRAAVLIAYISRKKEKKKGKEKRVEKNKLFYHLDHIGGNFITFSHHPINSRRGEGTNEQTNKQTNKQLKIK